LVATDVGRAIVAVVDAAAVESVVWCCLRIVGYASIRARTFDIHYIDTGWGFIVVVRGVMVVAAGKASASCAQAFVVTYCCNTDVVHALMLTLSAVGGVCRWSMGEALLMMRNFIPYVDGLGRAATTAGSSTLLECLGYLF